MPDTPCPKCQSDNAYSNGMLMVCPDCEHEWNPEEVVAEAVVEDADGVVRDANGNVLQDGDSVVIMKDLPVKGSHRDIKSGTKVKNIKLTQGDHNIDCKIEGFGSVALKSKFVRKV